VAKQTHYTKRDKPRKRPLRHKKSKSKSEIRQQNNNRYKGQGR